MRHPISDPELLVALRVCVERARPGLDTGLGIKMLYSDVASLSNPVWTVGLNPGGSHPEPDQWHREDGAHDYRDGYLNQELATSGPKGLQLREQLAAMLAWLGVDWRETLSLNLVPFRSARWDAMSPQWRKASLAFAADDFWPLLLAHRRPRLVVAFGAEPARTLRRLLGHGEVTSYPVGWGEYTADVSGGEGGNGCHTPATGAPMPAVGPGRPARPAAARALRGPPRRGARRGIPPRPTSLPA